MPNTLAHLGLQLLPGLPWLKHIDIRWAALGILIPDIPWILQRILLAVPLEFSIDGIRAYMTVLSTPLFCLLLAFAISRLVQKPNLSFGIIAANSIFHHILDALQVKWDIGIPLFAPIQWKPYTWNIIPTEGAFIYIATLVGLILSLWLIFKHSQRETISNLLVLTWKRLGVLFALTLAYFYFPLLVLQKPYEYNYFNLAVWTPEVSDNRSYIILDRADYIPGNPDKIHNQSLPKPVIPQNLKLDDKSVISLKGELLIDGTVRIEDYYIHHSYFRNYASIMGLLLILLIWVFPEIKGRKPPRNIHA